MGKTRFIVSFILLLITIHPQTFDKISPSGGDVVELLSLTNNPDISYAIVKKHGLFKRDLLSSDSWSQVVDELVFDLEKDKQDNLYYASERGLYLITKSNETIERIYEGVVYQVMCRMDSLIIIDTTNTTEYQEEYPPYLITFNNGKTWSEWETTKSRNIPSPWPNDEWDKRGSFLITENGDILRSQERKIFRGHIDSMDVWEELNSFDPEWLTPQFKFLPILENGTVYAYSRYVDMHPGGFEQGGLFKTTTFGDSWEAVGDFNDVSFATIIGLEVFVGTPDGNVFRLETGNETPHETASFGGEITGIERGLTNLIVSTKGNIFSSSNNGTKWNSADEGINFPFITGLQIVNMSASKRMVASVRNSGIWISDDLGSNWKKTENYFEVVPGQLKACNDGEVIYAAGASLYASLDFGETWYKCPWFPVAYYNWYGRVRDFEIDPGDNFNIYLVYDDHSIDDGRGPVFINTNYNRTTHEWTSKLLDEDRELYGWLSELQFEDDDLWTSSYGGNPALQRLTFQDTSLVITKSIDIPAASHVGNFLVRGGLLVTVYRENNWYSNDNGNSWNEFSTAEFQNYRFEDFNVYDELGELIVNASGEIFYVHPGNGVFFSKDLGNTWKSITSQYPATNFFSVEFVGDNTFYLVADDGIYKCNSIVSVGDGEVRQQLPEFFTLKQNYPNPFNPTTTIEYSIPFSNSPLLGELAPTSRGDFGKVRLVIYDILGTEVSTLVNKQQAPGNYKVDFEASELPSGIYFYKLSSGAVSITKKMTLVK